MKLSDVKAKGREAAELEKLGGGDFRVMFCPGMFYDDDRDAANHLFHVTLDESVFSVNLDDRDHGESLCFQLVDRLREAADGLMALATRVEGILNEQGERQLNTPRKAVANA